MDAERYTVEELSTVTGHTVRNIRYYTTLGLLPAPERQGRIAVYGAEHRARLELISSLAEHGFTLEAIGRQLSNQRGGMTTEDLAIRRALITSWTTESPDDVQARIGRELLELGMPRDALAAAHEATSRHMAALAEELDAIMRTQIVDAWARGDHSVEEAERWEKGLPRLRDLTVEAIVVSFQDAANRVIARALGRVR